ncbi:MAG TPA: vWA domain-containing protein, partial [Dehalococcoidia bacterium]|nr:vWA domain-containing protein [Dehalococcoidia bacterium]
MHAELNRMRPISVHVALAVAAIAALAAAFAASARPIAAQQPDPGSPTLVVNQVDASGYPEMRVVVTALDAAGVPVAGLTAADFSATSEGGMTVATVERAEDTTLQLAVILVVDTSGSMEGAPLDAAKQAARQFVARLGPNDRASLVAFSDEVRTVVPLTADAAALTAGIDGLTATGATSLYEAVQAAAFIARTSGTPRQAVVFLSDGENDTTTSEATEAGSLDIARANGVPVFAIGFGEAADTGYLQRLSAETRGQFFAADAADVGAVYGAIAGLLRSQYVVTLRAGAEADGEEATLQVSASIAGQAVTSEPVAFTR